ncbi:MAG: DUF2442 domain-containing protein [Lachnospiraceae bacterium]|nr:DUF2442 domain-containing protein [Lachnospiraceae bacterium]
MIPRMTKVEPRDNFILYVMFDDGQEVLYDVKDDIETISDFYILKSEIGLFEHVQVDKSRTCVYWNDKVDLPSDTILEYGKKLAGFTEKNRTDV